MRLPLGIVQSLRLFFLIELFFVGYIRKPANFLSSCTPIACKTALAYKVSSICDLVTWPRNIKMLFMSKTNTPRAGIPVSLSLNSALEAEQMYPVITKDKKRLLVISLLAVLIAMAISFIARGLVYLIDLVTNISFNGTLSIAAFSPGHHQLGAWVILIPVAGGLIVGLMALYGS